MYKSPVPLGAFGSWLVKKFLVTESDVAFQVLRAALNPQRPTRIVPEGEWMKLVGPYGLMMTDTPDEISDHQWSKKGLGHDAINQDLAVNEMYERLGFGPYKSGWCQECEGEGQFLTDPAWVRYDPPEGEGWQLWENATEGSPISPVFSDEQTFRGYLLSEGYTPQAVDRFMKVTCLGVIVRIV